MACFGYFIPFSAKAWCGTRPAGSQVNNIPGDDSLFDLAVLPETVFEKNYESGLTVKVSRDGLVLLKFHGIPGYADNVSQPKNKNPTQEDYFAEAVKFRAVYIQALNAHLACLGGALGVENIALNLGHVALNKIQEANDSMEPTVSRSRQTGEHISARHRSSYTSFPHADSRNIRSKIISLTALELASDNLNKLVTMPKKHAVNLASMFTRAVSSHEEHDFARSLITSWAIIEFLLGLLWEQLMQNNEPPITGNRKKKWKDNSFTASIKVEMLSVAKILNDTEYNLIDAARKERNAWMHALEDLDFRASMRAAYTAAILFERIYGIPLSKRYPAWV